MFVVLFFPSSGPTRRVLCFNMSKIALSFRHCKIRHKKGVHETTTCTPVGISVGSVGISVGIIFSAAPQRHFCTLQPVAAHGLWHRSVPTCSRAYA